MATIKEIARAEEEYAEVTARSGCVEFVDKSLNVCCNAIAILHHKDDISGGDSYGVKDGAWLPPLMNFEWSGRIRPLSATNSKVDLMAYLRTSILECAGFPGLLGNKAFEPIRVRLIESLPVF